MRLRHFSFALFVALAMLHSTPARSDLPAPVCNPHPPGSTFCKGNIPGCDVLCGCANMACTRALQEGAWCDSQQCYDRLWVTCIDAGDTDDNPDDHDGDETYITYAIDLKDCDPPVPLFPPPASPFPSHLQDATPSEPAGTCTTDPEFWVTSPLQSGVISNLVNQIGPNLLTLSSGMYDVLSTSIGPEIILAMTLYILIYGILFATGILNITVYDFSIRILKIGVITMMLGGVISTILFFEPLYQFFQQGTDAILTQLMYYSLPGSIGFNTVNPAASGWSNMLYGSNITTVNGGGSPFFILDWVFAMAISGRLFVTWLAMFFTVPYGPFFAGLAALALLSFGRALLTAVWVYLLALIVRALLLGTMPIFIPCILFERTRHMFDGWLNQLINTCLQPIFLFAFFGFFTQMVGYSMYNLMSVPVCWTEASEALRGTPFNMHFWRFELWNGVRWEPYGGSWDMLGTGNGGPPFPLDIGTILILFIMAELANRFNSVVIMIASDLAGASTNLGSIAAGGIADWFSPARNAEQRAAAKGTGSRDGGPPPGALAGDPGNPRQGGRAGGARGGAFSSRRDEAIAAARLRPSQEIRKRMESMSGRRGDLSNPDDGDGLA